MITKKHIILALLAASTLGGCTPSLTSRHEVAENIARTAAMRERVSKAGMFNLTAWERISEPDTPTAIYIEGDGLAWLDKHTKSSNPTPPDPLALRLAAADKSGNVIYMARPCQYTGWNGGGACPDIYWTNGLTAAEVISSYNLALDNIKTAYHVTGFNLIGYSGGAGVAALLAAERKDILSLRTIAGNMDYAAFSAIHSVSRINASLDPISAAPEISGIPQQHFIGGKDNIIPQEIFNSWKTASGKTSCIRSTIVQGNTHEKGWVENWPELLKAPLDCANH